MSEDDTVTTDLDHADRASLEHFAIIGELAGPLAHEITNFLNVILLQVSLLETILPEEQRADLLEIRRQGNRAAELVNRFQEQRRSRPTPHGPPGRRTPGASRFDGGAG